MADYTQSYTVSAGKSTTIYNFFNNDHEYFIWPETLLNLPTYAELNLRPGSAAVIGGSAGDVFYLNDMNIKFTFPNTGVGYYEFILPFTFISWGLPYENRITFKITVETLYIKTTVHFNGGSHPNFSESMITHTPFGQALPINNIINSVTREGYSGLGINTDRYAQSVFDSYYPSEDKTVYIIWGYKLSFHTFIPLNDILLFVGESTILPNPVHNDYVFKGWYTSSSGGWLVAEGGVYFTPSSSWILYGQWVLKVTIYFKGNGGTPSVRQISAGAGEYVSLTTATRSGYMLKGWQIGGVLYVPGGNYVINADVDAYAIWAKRCTVSYDVVMSGAVVDRWSDVRFEGDKVSLPNASYPNYDFIGWFTTPHSTLAQYMAGYAGGLYTVPANDITLYAAWRKKYEISFTDSLNFSPPSTIYCSPGSPITLPQATTGGTARFFNFDGWYNGSTRVGGSGSSYTPSGDITLTAGRTQIGGMTGNAEWYVIPIGNGKYSLKLRFSASGQSTANYISPTDKGIVYQNGVALERWTVNNYFANIVKIVVEADGTASNLQIGTFAFAGMTGVTEFEMSNRVGVINANAFKGCLALRSVNLDNGVITIGESAFENCNNVKIVEVGRNVKTIRNKAFATLNDGTMTLIHVPNSVTAIEAGAFGTLEFKIRADLPVIDYTDEDNFVGYSYVRSTQSNTLFRQADWYVIRDDVAGTRTLYVAYNGAMPNYLPSGAPWHTEYPEPNMLTHVVIRAGCSSVGDYAFYNLTGVHSVHIPDTVLTIGNHGFSGSGITSLDISDSVISIADGAFQNCASLTHLSIGDSVATIGSGVFEGCDALTSLEIPIDLKADSETTFNGMTHLTHVTIVRGRSGVGTTYTATYVNGAFEGTYTYTPWHKSSGNNLTITLRDGILSIGQAAFFHNAGLRTITIPDSVISIGTAAFSHCSNLTAIKIPSNIKIVSARTFERCTSLVDLSIGGTVTAIGDYAFYGCTALPSLIIPNSVTTIGYKSFSDCTNLMSAVVGSSVTSIGLDAPGDGDDLITDYPNGPDAFLGCVKLYFVFNLSPLDIVAGASTHGYVAFYAKRVYDYFESSGNVEFVVHNGYVFSRINGKDYLIGYTGTDTEVAPPAEYEYHGETITSYGVYQKAFLNSPITSIVLPDTVTEIDDYAFYGCKNLSSVLAPPTCKRIGNYAFSGCDALQQIVLPSYLRTIGEYAFSESALTSITIPRYVDSMGTGAFLDSVGEPSHLTSVTFAGYTPIPAFCFMGCTSLTTANTPYVTQIGISAFDGCSALTEILIPDSVILVGEDAFAGCAGLTKITIGDKAKGLDMSAFPGFTFTEYMGGPITTVNNLYGYTYIGANYIFTQKGNVFKFIIRYFRRNQATPFRTETYTFTRRDTVCILADRSEDDTGKRVKDAMQFTDSYTNDGMTYRFKRWTAGSSGYSGVAVLPGDKYELNIFGVNENQENVATLDLHAFYEWDDDIQFYLKKYSKQHAAKFQQELQSPEWYTGADGQQNLIPLYKTTEMFVTADSTAIAPGKVVYGKPDGTGVWNYFFLGNDNEITEYDAPFTDPHTLEAMHDLVGVTFDLSSCQIQSLSRTIKANLTTIPTMIYGAENRFIIDLGTQMSYTLRIVRVNPPNAVSLDNYQFEHGRFRWGTALTMDWTTWYAIKDEVGFANLTNGDFYRLLLIFVDEWQNNLRNSDAVLTGGFEFFCSSIDSLQFNKIDKRVFIAGTIQAEVDVQKMSISIPLTVASMQTDDTSLENVKVTAYIKAGSLADITGAFDKQVEYSFPLSANIPTPLPPIDWELYMGSRAPPKSFNGWRVEPEGSSSYTVGIGEFMTITSAANMYAQWADGVTGGAVTPDSGIPGTTPGDNAEFKTLCELYGELVKPNHLYTLAITMVGGGGGGNPWSGSQIDPLIHAGGGGGGGGGALRFSIEGVNSSKDKIAMVKGRGGKGPILYTPPQSGAIHIANAIAIGSYDGGDSIFKLKKDGQSEVFVFTAKGGKSFENGFVFLAGHVGDAFKRGLSGGGYTLPSSGYTLDYAANGGDGGYGGDTSDGHDGGLPEIVLGSATDANWKGGKGGKRASVQYLVLFQKWMGGGAGGGAAAYDVKNDKTSRGGDGGTYTTDATAPKAGGGGGGGVRSQQIINDFNTRRTHGAQGDIYVRILGGTPAP